MGTNYYAHIKVCPHCNKAESVLHIGKDSFGWTFSFRGYDILYDDVSPCDYVIVSKKDWKELLDIDNVIIVDEYNNVISKEDFWKHVDNKKNEPYNHAKLVKDKDPMMFKFGFDQEYYDSNWLDEEGNSFTDREFS